MPSSEICLGNEFRYQLVPKAVTSAQVGTNHTGLGAQFTLVYGGDYVSSVQRESGQQRECTALPSSRSVIALFAEMALLETGEELVKYGLL